MLLSSYYAIAYCIVSLIAESSWQLAAESTRFKFNSHESVVLSPLVTNTSTLKSAAHICCANPLQ